MDMYSIILDRNVLNNIIEKKMIPNNTRKRQVL